MTTKELFSRLSGYSELDSAAAFFSMPMVNQCYQVCVLTVNSRLYFYSLDLLDFSSFVKNLDVCSILIDNFTRSDFMIQVKYFKAFFNRASKSQQDYIKRSLLVNNLLPYLDDSSCK